MLLVFPKPFLGIMASFLVEVFMETWLLMGRRMFELAGGVIGSIINS